MDDLPRSVTHEQTSGCEAREHQSRSSGRGHREVLAEYLLSGFFDRVVGGYLFGDAK